MSCLDRDSSPFELRLSWVRALLDLAVLSLIVLGNAFIVFAVARHWRRQGVPCGSKTSTFLVLSLSSADALVGVFGVFHFLPRYLCALKSDLGQHFAPCVLRFALVLLAHLASGYTLVAVAFDRYVAIVHPLKYGEILNTRRSLAMVAAVWTLAVGGSSLLFAWNRWRSGGECVEDQVLPVGYTLVVGTLGQAVIMGSVTYAHWRIHRVILGLRGPEPSSGLGTRSSRMLLLILGCYVTSWAPFMVAFVLKSSGVDVPVLVLEVASSLVNLNYLVNPFIYAYNNRPVRRAMRGALNNWRRRPGTVLHEPTASGNESGTKT